MSDVLRLIYPEWQGGYAKNIFNCLNQQFPIDKASTGYYLGAQIANLVVPPLKDSNEIVETVPISREYNEESLRIENNIFAYRTIKNHLESAVSILRERDPKKCIVIGGTCAVSTAPFKHMIAKYGSDNVAMIWIDAHPDLIIPGDGVERHGFHEMPIPHIMGLEGTDKEYLNILPKGNLKPSNLLYLGLHIIGDIESNRIAHLNLQKLSPEDYRQRPDALNEWIKNTGCSKVIIHFDLDVLEPSELFCAVGKEPNGMYIKEVVDAINRINTSAEIVCITIAEHMPQIQMKMQQLFQDMSIF